MSPQENANVLRIDFDSLEKEVRAYEKQQQTDLGLESQHQTQWSDQNPQQFSRQQREVTTILFGGMTLLHDQFIQAALRHLGYKLYALDCPNNDSMQLGKEFGNRGQCNPTYFTVGNLVKHLIHLRDEQGISTEEIIGNYLFVTAGACGPCRFGMYVTEYRKALRDAGFEGFRVLLFQSEGGINQAMDEVGLDLSPTFFLQMFRGIVAGDVMNLMAYRMRPYEFVEGSVDNAMAECRQIVCDALKHGKSVVRALKQCKAILDQVELNRMQAKPKVSIIGEFWAMTTEGDGNYHLQRFLEQEGAEVDSQPVTNWTLYVIWSMAYDLRRQLQLKPSWRQRLLIWKKLALLKLAQKLKQVWFNRYAKAIGLDHYKLADMRELADISHSYYANELRGGEGHMEVGKLIQVVEHRKAHLVISVKPFGCMPSSGVSDGVQSLVTAKLPDANFLAIETSGDGAVNVYSRIQMALFKAREKAQQDLSQSLERYGDAIDQIEQKLVSSRRYRRATAYPPHRVAATAANLVTELNQSDKRLDR